MDNEILMREGRELADKISATKMLILNKSTMNEARKEKLKMIEQATMNTITSEVRDDGKPKFSNDASRQAELAMQLIQNKEYQDMKKEMLNEMYEIEMLKIEVEKHKNILDLIINLTR